MKQAIRGVRALAASLSLAAGVTATGVVLAPLAMADFGTIRATTAVNVRSQPSASSSILKVLYQGESTKQTGPIKNGFVPVSVGGRTGWVAANYVIGARATSDAPASASGVKATRYTAEAVNVRTGPSTGYRSLTVLAKGTAVSTTGLVSKGWTQVTYKGERAWISTSWLSASRPSSTTTTVKLTSARATADLLIRSGPGKRFTTLGEIPKGTVINLTGLTEPGVAQVLWRGDYRWVNASYIVGIKEDVSPLVPKSPTAIGTQYATEGLNIRTKASTSASIVTTVARGTGLKVTGKVSNGFAEVVWNGASRWASASYLSATPPSGGGSGNTGNSQGMAGLTPNATSVVNAARSRFSFITTVYGVRPDPIPDHPSGKAVDLMLPNWSSSAGNARGWEVANYMRANASRLGIQYIIFDQKIWNIDRNGEGWRSMADRGSATANHKDHVHVTVK